MAALVYGLIQLHGRSERDRAYTIFTDSTAAMRRITGDALGPGQEMATRAIEIAERVVGQGNSITIRWTPAHRGVEGNERADQAAKEVAELPPLRTTRDRFSLAYLGRRATERATRRWREDTRTRIRQAGLYTARPSDTTRHTPPIENGQEGSGGEVFQLLSGHAMIAPYLKERWGWIDTDRCWWCDGGRQGRDHLFKECKTWKDEIRVCVCVCVILYLLFRYMRLRRWRWLFI